MTVFISYSRKDKELPEFQALLADINLMKTEVWMDEKVLGGQAWWDEILKQIRECEVFIPVLTKRSLKSKACGSELVYAQEARRSVLPVRIVDLADWELPGSLVTAQVIDYSKRAAGGNSGVSVAFGLRDAIEELKATATQELPDPLPSSPAVPPTYLNELGPLLKEKELTLAKQEFFVQGVRSHLNDEDEDLKSLIDALRVFRTREDIAHRIAIEVDELLQNISSTESVDPLEKEIQPERNKKEMHPAPTIGRLLDSPPPPPKQASKPSAFGTLSHKAPKITRFDAPGVDVIKLGENLRGWYQSQKLEAQSAIDGERIIVQCRSKTWARRLGAGTALTAILYKEGDQLAVEIGGGQWMDKVAAAGVAWFILWPAIIPAAIGGFKTATLPSKSLHYIEEMIPLFADHK